MSGFPVTCTNCGHHLRDENETPCPNCMEATAHSMLSARVSMTIRKIETEIKKNWVLLVILVLCDVVSVVPAYFLSGWASVAVTVLFILFSTVIGYYAITRVITITTETK